MTRWASGRTCTARTASKYENVFAAEEPAVYAEIDRGDLVVTQQVYEKGDPLYVPVGRGSHHLPLDERASSPSGTGYDNDYSRAVGRREAGPDRAPDRPLRNRPDDRELRAPDGRATHVLFVEDDDVIREATQLALERDGFVVTAMPDGLSGLEAFRADRPDIALLDVMVPGLDGVSLCRRIRDESTVPVIMLSARADSIDVVLGLEAGADDYVTKPFDGAVLVARIRAVLRRFGHASGAAGGRARSGGQDGRRARVLSFGDLEIDTEGMEVRRAGAPVALTPTEMRLLLEFSSAPGTVLSRDKLLERVWDYGWGGDTRVVDVHVQRLRTKIGQDRIETVRGFGYKLKA